MPNKTIYVSDADLPIFERAQQLAGGNLSATIAQALRQYIETQEARASGFQEITVPVGSTIYTQKRFIGRRITKAAPADFQHTYEIFLTAKGKIVLYTTTPHQISMPPGAPFPQVKRNEYQLEVYETPEALAGHLPEDIYLTVVQKLKGETVEFLDI